MTNCTNLIVHCMDFRIQKTIERWIHEMGMFGDLDRVSLAGPCRSGQPTMDYIRAGYELHGIKHVFLSQHIDCGAYGGHDAFASLEAEREKLKEDMLILGKTIRDSFPEVQVTMLMIEEVGDSWEVVETGQI